MTPDEYAFEIDRLAEELEAMKHAAFPPEAKKLMEKGICLFCEKPITGEKHVRGCHQNCYRKTKREIESGGSEGKAISLGLLAPEQKSGRKIEPIGLRAEMLKHLKTGSEFLSQVVPDDDLPQIPHDIGRKKKSPPSSAKSVTKSVGKKKQA